MASLVIGLIVFAIFFVFMLLKAFSDSNQQQKNVQLRIASVHQSGYELTKHITTNSGHRTFGIDENKRKVIYIDSDGKSGVFDFSDIISCELIENGATLSKTSIGGAVAGAVLAGGAGAIIGSRMGNKSKSLINRIELVITVNSISNPNIHLVLYNGDGKMKSLTDAASGLAREWNSVMKVVLSRKEV